MTDLTNVSIGELQDELKKRGVYPIITLSADDILDDAEQQGVLITKEQAERAALMIYNEYDIAPEFSELLEIAVNQAKGE